MTLELNKDSIERFAEQLQEAYDKNSILSAICDVRTLDQAKGDGDFFQIGRRTNFPYSIVSSGISKVNANKIAKEIANGEKRFLLNNLEKAAEESQIDSTQIEGELTTKGLMEACQESPGADQILLPIVDEYWHTIHGWNAFDIEKGSSRAEGRIDVGSTELDVHWLPSQLGIKDVFLIDSDRVEVVQKRFGEPDPPQEINPTSKYNDIIDKHPFMIYFGSEVIHDEDDEDFPEKIELVYRIVLSEPRIVHQSAAHRLVSPPRIELEPENEKTD